MNGFEFLPVLLVMFAFGQPELALIRATGWPWTASIGHRAA